MFYALFTVVICFVIFNVNIFTNDDYNLEWILDILVAF